MTAAVLLVAAVAAGCGIKGPLKPPPAAPSSAAPASPAASATPAAPADDPAAARKP
jgi:predicted small lipoprotein YifL